MSQIFRVHFSAGEHDIDVVLNGEHDINVVLNKSFLTFIGTICDPMVIVSFQKCDSSAEGIIEDLQPTGFTVFPSYLFLSRLFVSLQLSRCV
jgi:hypothetical protein